MAKILVDTSEFPVFHLKFPAEISREDVDELGVALLAGMRRGKIVTVSDINAIAVAGYPASIRQYFADMVKRIYAERPNIAAESVYTENAVARGVYTAYTWLMGGPYPSKCFRTRDEALAWSIGHLRAAR